MPVFDHVGAVGEVAEGLQTKLARVRGPLWKSLRLGLDEEIVLAVANRAGKVATEGDLGAGELGFSGVVDVDAGDIQRTGGFEVVDAGLDAVGEAAPVEVEVLGEELIFACVGADQACLPREVIRD